MPHFLLLLLSQKLCLEKQWASFSESIIRSVPTLVDFLNGTCTSCSSIALRWSSAKKEYLVEEEAEGKSQGIWVAQYF